MTRNSILFIALLLSHTLGCGDPDAAAEFVGTWTYSSGTATASCGGPSRTEPLTGTLSIAAGIDADLAIVEGSECVIRLDVAGTIATARPNQSCDGAADGVSVKRSISGMTLSRNGSTVTINETSTLSVIAGGLTTTCNFSRSGVLSRITK
jgi:hypothetical protein